LIMRPHISAQLELDLIKLSMKNDSEDLEIACNALRKFDALKTLEYFKYIVNHHADFQNGIDMQNAIADFLTERRSEWNPRMTNVFNAFKTRTTRTPIPAEVYIKIRDFLETAIAKKKQKAVKPVGRYLANYNPTKY
jgi:hypothetical protein